jgi:hypothetical protein
MSETQPVLIFVRDLLFAGRIIAEARAINVSFKVIRDPARLLEEPGARLIVDLNQDGAIDAAAQWRARYGGHVIGFVSHVDTETIAKARDQGIDQILSRGQFVQVVGELLRVQ